MAVPLRRKCSAASLLVTAIALAACPALSASTTSEFTVTAAPADLLYNRLRLAKEIQLNMWSHLCVRTAALACGRL
jgi:hypothetical protein